MDSKTRPIAKKGSSKFGNKRPKGWPKSQKNDQKGCQAESIDVADELDHHNFNETIQNTMGEGNQTQRKENHCHERPRKPKKHRNTSCDNSRSQKEYGIAIIDQARQAISNLSAEPSQSIKKLLDILNGPHVAKTKFLLLCILIANVPCMYSLGSMLDKILMNKMNRLLRRNEKKDKTKLEQKIQHLKLFQDIRVKLSGENQDSILTIFQIQDIMTNQLFKCRQSPLQYTRKGLQSQLSKKLGAVDIASVLLEFGVYINHEPFDRQARLQHIRPNLGGIPVEDVRMEYLYIQEQSPCDEYFCLCP